MGDNKGGINGREGTGKGGGGMRLKDGTRSTFKYCKHKILFIFEHRSTWFLFRFTYTEKMSVQKWERKDR